MQNNQDKPIPISLILFVMFISILIFLYLKHPVETKLDKAKTFEEQLEFSTPENVKTSENATSKENTSKVIYVNNDLNIPPSVPAVENLPSIPSQTKVSPSYNSLLDELKNYQTKTESEVQVVVNKLLEFKGYPAGIVKVVATEIDQSKAKMQDNYMVANFDFSSGNLKISPKMMYELDNKVLIAILAHELDHFDKLANTCKSMGVTNFKQLFKDNGIPIDENFWSRATLYAKDTNFNAELYKDALKRFITQNDVERTSSYADLYRLSETMRNPLEASAYNASDNVYNYYRINMTEGPIKRLTKKFNEVDWAIYNITQKDKSIEKERVALFDYFFSQAIITKLPQYKKEYENCIRYNDGDLTKFWLAYEKSMSSFYQKGTMSNETYNTIYSLLSETEEQTKKPLSKQQIAQAMKFKINTLSSNLVYHTAEKNLRLFLVDYLKYIKANSIEDYSQELKCIAKLLCLENKLYMNNTNKGFSLYDLVIPAELKEIYGLEDSKKGKFKFIYSNSEFQKMKKEGVSDQQFLTDLINQNRIDLRVK